MCDPRYQADTVKQLTLLTIDTPLLGTYGDPTYPVQVANVVNARCAVGRFLPLRAGWTVTLIGAGLDAPALPEPIPARVPGSIFTDLMAAGVIDDPLLDDNELRVPWVSRSQWAYETTFDLPAGSERVCELVCAGLDTVATIILNGVEVGRTANMHRSYRFDVTALLRDTDNRLRINFEAPYDYADRLRAKLGERSNQYSQPFNFIRKIASSFGWDWGPTLPGCGIWQEIGLHSWSAARLAQVRPQVRVRDGTGHVDLFVDLDRRDNDVPLTVQAECAGNRVDVVVEPGADGVLLELNVDHPALWWPRGHGEQPLYDVTVALTSTAGRNGETLDSWKRAVGFRTVALDTQPDAHGRPFTVVVNDKPIFVRGMNWIPDDIFPARVTADRYRRQLARAHDANVNLVRVWGGGRYESEDFYATCDALGLMVMQDFLFACAAYPEEEPLAGEVAAEAREQVVRLAHHPSLVTWLGNNENLWGFADWEWEEAATGRSWGAGYYFDLLPSIVAELDPGRPYWPGSPYSGSRDLHPNDPSHGTSHVWDVWNERDYVHYRDVRPRFVAEFGYQGPPAFATLRRSISDDPLTPTSAGLLHHQKAAGGALKLQRGLAAHMPDPRDFDHWHYLTQVNQARAVTLGIEHFRSLTPYCMGAIVWQFNDCWPATSWSAVDGDGRRKPLWYAIRSAFADRIVTIQPSDGGLAVIVVNDSDDNWQGQADVARLTLAGDPLAKVTLDIDVAPRSALALPVAGDVATPGNPGNELLAAVLDNDRSLWFYSPDRDLAYARPDYDVSVDAAPIGYEVTINTRSLLRDLMLRADRLDPAAEVDHALVTLLPGESTTFNVRTNRRLDHAALGTPPVLCHLDDGGE